MKTNRKLMLAALATASVAWVPLPAAAQVYVEVAPPAPRHEVVPAYRAGYVWSPGYWDWRAGRYVWVRGHWVRERPGMYWHPNRWIERDGHWYFERGRWDRERYAYHRGYGDRDRDGIPNRYDRDRDNDGVPNRFDERPNNPYRR